jgi:hypothetical protein
MFSCAQALKSSVSLKQALVATHSLNIYLLSWQRGGCFSWSGSKYFSHVFLINLLILLTNNSILINEQLKNPQSKEKKVYRHNLNYRRKERSEVNKEEKIKHITSSL